MLYAFTLFIGLYLTYNIILVLGVQHSESIFLYTEMIAIKPVTIHHHTKLLKYYWLYSLCVHNILLFMCFYIFVIFVDHLDQSSILVRNFFLSFCSSCECIPDSFYFSEPKLKTESNIPHDVCHFLYQIQCTNYSSNYTLHREVQLGKTVRWYFSYKVCQDSILNQCKIFIKNAFDVSIFNILKEVHMGLCKQLFQWRESLKQFSTHYMINSVITHTKKQSK